jgi:hypothetical protein
LALLASHSFPRLERAALGRATVNEALIEALAR